ncbi:MAG TPA: 2-C-methyl-D-erythritol 2,4-cyclodiphosphate synthase [Bacteroidota bacterium]|nr:2-C-methyl-D-erythritol 2,4-cyclodiphosphate synthase [Bacteroidota bacterium]
MASEQRIGFGYDVHRLAEGRRLVLGGVDIPFAMGLDGHSDADVLLHAVSDALLGAAALGDIGKHFPNTDPRYKGISSLILLRHVADLLAQKRCTVVNIDATVVLEAPKIAPYVDLMRQNIADSLAISIGQISVKATTHEGLGFVGTGKGASAHAVALLSMHERKSGKSA